MPVSVRHFKRNPFLRQCHSFCTQKNTLRKSCGFPLTSEQVLTLKRLGGGHHGPPLNIFRDHSAVQNFWTAPLSEFFLWSLAQLLRPISRRPGTWFRSYVTFSKCMSDPKLLKNVISCTKPIQILFLAKNHKWIIIFTFND